MPRPNRGASLKWIPKRKCFYIVWYEAGRERVRSTGTADGIAAEDALAEFIRERRRDEPSDGPRDPASVSIAEVLDVYGVKHAPHAADPVRIAYALDALLPFWADKSVAQVSKDSCRRYATQRARADATVRRELGTLRAALNFAVTEKLIAVAPFVLLPDKPEGKDRWLTRSEAAAVLEASRTGRADVRLYLPLFILIGLYTGARKQAILELRWPQVDFEREQINFAKPGEKRTNKGKARIPIPRQLLTFLRLARKRGTDLGYVVHDKGAKILDIGGGWAGGDRRGEGSFGGACKRAGITGVTPHTLRHTCGTWMAQRGVPIFKIAGWLGHSDARTTELYAHHHPDFQSEAKAGIEKRR